MSEAVTSSFVRMSLEEKSLITASELIYESERSWQQSLKLKSPFCSYLCHSFGEAIRGVPEAVRKIGM